MLRTGFENNRALATKSIVTILNVSNSECIYYKHDPQEHYTMYHMAPISTQLHQPVRIKSLWVFPIKGVELKQESGNYNGTSTRYGDSLDGGGFFAPSMNSTNKKYTHKYRLGINFIHLGAGG